MGSDATNSLSTLDNMTIRERPTVAYRCARLAFKVAMHSLFRLKVQGRERLPAGSFIGIANHTQWVDVLITTAELPASPQLYTLSDLSATLDIGMDDIGLLGRLPVLKNLQISKMVSWYLRHVGGVISFDPAEFDMGHLMDVSARALDAGGRYMIYPEGEYEFKDGDAAFMVPSSKRFAAGEGLYPFKRGFAFLAVSTGAPVVPMALRYVRTLHLRKRIELVIGEPIAVSPIDRLAEPVEYANAVRELTLLGQSSVLDLMRPDYPRHGPRLFARQLTMDKVRNAMTQGSAATHDRTRPRTVASAAIDR